MDVDRMFDQMCRAVVGKHMQNDVFMVSASRQVNAYSTSDFRG